METNETILEKQIKKSEMKADNLFDYEYLMQEREGLLPCSIREEGEDIIFEFQIEGMRPFEELRGEELEYQYRFLQNIYKLKKTWQDYLLRMDENNLYFDRNFMPYAAFRDIKNLNDADNEAGFFEVYQELAAGILNDRYSYEQVKESGIQIIRKDKKASFILSCETAEELYSCIREKADKLYEINKNQKIRLNKKGYLIRTRILLGVLAALLAALVFTGYQTFAVLPRDRAVIQASRAYTVQNYVECIDCLKEIAPEQMDTYTKYILAVSYAKSEALQKAELANVLEKLSIYSNEIELEYWIAVGRSSFEKAENYAKALSDDKLLIYAYMKELNYLEGNVAMDGEEKQNRMNELSNSITEIGKKYTG